MNGAQALVGQLEALGVEAVFGIPGVHNLAVFDALRDSAIRTVVVRHEQAAGYAADGYARATGRLGVALTTTGPGAANAAAAMGEARASRSPVLHVSTQVDSRLLAGGGGRFSLHESPHQKELMEAVCAWAATVERADAVAAMVRRAAAEALDGRRGPAFLEVPHDLLSARTSAPSRDALAIEPVPPIPEQVRRAVARLRRARRPLVWAGGGAISAGAADAVRATAERLDAPVVATYAGKGILPPSHPLALGLPPHQPEATKLISGSDAVLVVGSDLDAMNTQGWRLPLPRPRIAINVVGEDARRNYACDVTVEADARLGLEALLDELGPRRGAAPRAGARRVRDARAAAQRSLRASREFAAPMRFVDRLAAAAGDAFVLADMAVAGYWAAGYYPAPGPRAFAYPMGWGTLGFALPAAIGVAAAGRRALVVCGDGGFLFAAGELATLAQEGLRVAVLVVDDGGYGMLRFDQDERFGRRFAVDLAAPDFVALATSFGVPAKRATMAGIGPAVRWALGRDGPALVATTARFAPPLTTSPRWPLRGKPEARR